ncbi:hypothetical protein [Phytomonospora endophytica]|uniref:Uncharacterized protein n=1 Tax=Phytomonospora endophytica TaxID=714109 RepID=A0A841G0P9_9ACTN|nr:hypothetical protein [Phytomonospora endophytica]MBB6037740.1 hypothetical protein [Phytomonospora endophytica]GIG67733.1 hypothetical protein Pen01_40280 [Phytomonospora endophytica]
MRAKPCRCTYSGNTAIVADRPLGYRGEPFAECEQCRGDGAVLIACEPCAGGGQIRSQRVGTVVNIETAALASFEITPEADLPLHRADNGRWFIDTPKIVSSLLDEVGAVELLPDGGTGKPQTLLQIALPEGFTPDLPTMERQRMIRDGLVSGRPRRWSAYLATSAPRQSTAPETTLRELCRIADLMHVDLVIERRPFPASSPRFEVRLEPAGARLRDGNLRWHHGTLTEALAYTSVDRALHYMWLYRDRSTPARRIRPNAKGSAPAQNVAIAAIEQRLTDTGGTAGTAIAVWREGTWHYRLVAVVGENTTMTRLPTGQISHRTQSVYAIATRIPDPTYLGEATQTQPCAACVTGTAWERCSCAYALTVPETDCPRCAGTGQVPQEGSCSACGGVGFHQWEGTVTVTDLAARTVHLDWCIPFDADIEHVDTTPAGDPIYQLPAEYRLATILAGFGVDRERLVDESGTPITHDLHDGLVTAAASDNVQQVIGRYIARTMWGRGAGRMFLFITPAPDSTSEQLSRLISILTGLGIGLRVSLCSYKHLAGDAGATQGERWEVRAVHLDAPPQATICSHHTLGDAVDQLARSLPVELFNSATNHGPTQLLPAPSQAPQDSELADGFEELVRALAERYTPPTGTTVTCLITPTGTTVTLTSPRQEPVELAHAGTFTEAITTLTAASRLTNTVGNPDAPPSSGQPKS